MLLDANAGQYRYGKGLKIHENPILQTFSSKVQIGSAFGVCESLDLRQAHLKYCDLEWVPQDTSNYGGYKTTYTPLVLRYDVCSCVYVTGVFS